MRIIITTTLVLAGGLFLMGCEQMPWSEKQNPLLSDWQGPHQGVPPLDKIRPEHFEPALTKAMNEAQLEVERVTNQPNPPSFENTLVPLEKALDQFDRVESLYGLWVGNLNTPEMQKVEKRMSPALSKFWNQIRQDRKLYQRLQSLEKKEANLNAEKKRLITVHLAKMKKAGAALSPDQIEKVAKINERMSELQVQFSQNLLKEEEESFLHIKDKADLAGLSPSLIQRAAKEAQTRQLQGWVIANTRSAMEPFLTSSTQRHLREKAYKIWTARGDQGNSYDNNDIVLEILKLRRQRSQLLGYETYAHWQLQDRMAKKPDNAMALMEKVWQPALQQMNQDLKEINALAKSQGLPGEVEPWDYLFYAEKLREKKYNFDMAQVKPYLKYDNLLQAMFWSAGQHFGYSFKKTDQVPVFHEDVFVYEVSRDGQFVGLIYFDPYQRNGKRSGAWMSSYRSQSHMNKNWVYPLVTNNTNFNKAQGGASALLSWSDAVTMFHEFGHALHGLSSQVIYPSLSGTNTAVDFVELPSQFYENIISTPEALKFLKNDKGEPLPPSLVKKMEKASHFKQAFIMTEYLASAIVDLKLHTAERLPQSLKDFESEQMQSLRVPGALQMRHRIPHFSHIFSGEYYSAAYYSYLWADVLSRDAFASFEKGGGAFDKEKSKRFFNEILRVGNTVEPGQAYRNFRGQDPQVRALLEAKGFVYPKTTLPN